MYKLIAILALVAVSYADDWSVVAQNVLGTSLGIGFRNEKEGFLAGDSNGVGPQIFKSTDGGVTWNITQANFGADALLLALGAADETVIVSSIFGELYSDNDGDSFEQSLGGGLSQSVRYLGKDGDGGEKFGVAGTYRGHQGVAITSDAGRLFKPVFADELFTEARYAAYPTDTTWYIAAGEWPSSPSSSPYAMRRRSVFENSEGRIDKDFKSGLKDSTGYKAQIVKTTDGGQTWSTQVAVNNSFYFNGIDCTSEQHCCAVGESSDAPFFGAGIWCTFDGQNWNRTFYAQSTSKSHFSLMDVRWASDSLGWAIGGELSSLAPKAWFVKTTDGGKTWDPLSHQLFGYYAMGLDVVDANTAYAAVDNLLTQTSGVAKYSA